MNPHLSDAIEDEIARAEKAVYRIPEAVSCRVVLDIEGVIAASAKCIWPHPCRQPEHVAFVVVWTFDEWKTIEALCAEFKEAQQ